MSNTSARKYQDQQINLAVALVEPLVEDTLVAECVINVRPSFHSSAAHSNVVYDMPMLSYSLSRVHVGVSKDAARARQDNDGVARDDLRALLVFENISETVVERGAIGRALKSWVTRNGFVFDESENAQSPVQQLLNALTEYNSELQFELTTQPRWRPVKHRPINIAARYVTNTALALQARTVKVVPRTGKAHKRRTRIKLAPGEHVQKAPRQFYRAIVEQVEITPNPNSGEVPYGGQAERSLACVDCHHGKCGCSAVGDDNKACKSCTQRKIPCRKIIFSQSFLELNNHAGGLDQDYYYTWPPPNPDYKKPRGPASNN